MSKRRIFFKVLDPVIQKDVYKSMIIVWAGWAITQIVFFSAFELSTATNSYLSSGHGLKILFLLLSTALFLFFLVSIHYVVNKILGPIYRIKKDLALAKEKGEVAKVKLREKDYFQDLAEQINNISKRS